MQLKDRRRYAFAAAEHRLRAHTGRSHIQIVGRAATAIWATLRALDLHNRPVLIPANTCYIVLWAVLQSGNQPCLVDVDPETANITPELLDRCGVTTPAVLIPAHMYGLPAPMTALMAWAKARSVFVIEDAALALGAMVEGRPAGSWGDASVFSFGQGKIADAGGGGALLTDDARLAEAIRRLLVGTPPWAEPLQRLNDQWLDIYWALHQYEAYTPRLADVYPALFSIYGGITRCRLPDATSVREALATLDDNLKHRAALARLYDEAFADTPVRLLKRPEGAVLWRYPLFVPPPHRDPLLRALWGEGIFDVTRWYPSLQTMRRALAPDAPSTPTPTADQMADEVINLPLSPDTPQELVERITQIVTGYFAAHE